MPEIVELKLGQVPPPLTFFEKSFPAITPQAMFPDEDPGVTLGGSYVQWEASGKTLPLNMAVIHVQREYDDLSRREHDLRPLADVLNSPQLFVDFLIRSAKHKASFAGNIGDSLNKRRANTIIITATKYYESLLEVAADTHWLNEARYSNFPEPFSVPSGESQEGVV